MCIADKINNTIVDKFSNTVSSSTSGIHKSTPTLNPSHLTPTNYYDILSHLVDDDDTTVVMSNLSDKDPYDYATTATYPSTDDESYSPVNCHNINQLGQLQTPEDFAILDSGATAHFIIQGTNVLNQQPATQPLHIKLPNGSIIKSTHTCNLNIPWLPTSMTEAHIVPGLTHSSLVATKKFCDAGCTVTFDADKCHIFHQDNLVLEGIRDKVTGLWIIPLNPTTPQPNTAPPQLLV